MKRHFLVIAYFLFTGYGECALKISTYFGDHMVLQRAPQQAVLWGTADTEGDTVTVRLEGQGSDTREVIANVTQGQWKVKLPSTGPGGPYVIHVNSSDGDATLRDVLFGDVWLCSGQSNMQFIFGQVFNATEEITKAVNYTNIRIFQPGNVRSDTEEDDLNLLWIPWTQPTASTVRRFSGLCFLFGEYLQPHLGNVPLGLVEAAWGGTTIEAWSPPVAVNACAPVVHSRQPPDCCPQVPLVIWNSMIHPILSTTLYGAIWFQASANSDHPELYSCQFTNMIKWWRHYFHESSLGETPADLPFGFVQLGTMNDTSTNGTGIFPYMRWAQTANYGYSPNPSLPNTFMAVAMDLPDINSPYGTIHTRDKQDVARRLVPGALNVAYGYKDVVFQGPFPTDITAYNSSQEVIIEYSHGAVPLDVRSTDGFQVCCSEDSSTSCSGKYGWEDAPITGHDVSHVTVTYAACGSRHLVGLRYAWRSTPCGVMQCPLYAADTGLPAPPYIQKTAPVCCVKNDDTKCDDARDTLVAAPIKSTNVSL
ncbi:sialate O-acetylesterase-like isoform X2 [Littorina saxatilis]|uniref:sialate O-acetylesterase-like isoform X2 n=1 Tax=Littorina saxatilis TaxID=31220 RepID=UPI0038B4CF49